MSEEASPHSERLRLRDSLRAPIAVVFLCLLVFLRFGVLTIGIMLPEWGNVFPGWLFELGTYLFTAALIWLERERLADFNIDGFAVMLILIAKPVETLVMYFEGASLMPLAFPQFPSIIIAGCSASLGLALILSKRTKLAVTWQSVLWWLAGAGCGVLLAAALAYPSSLQIGATNAPLQFKTTDFLRKILLRGFIYQTGFAAVSEEPLFRGFLWGYLRKLGLSPIWAWLLIAFSFTIGHLFYFGSSPISLFVIVPVVSLALGLIAWKSKTISSSLGLHAATNALGAYFGYIFASLR
jgi:hypothetical protein